MEKYIPLKADTCCLNEPLENSMQSSSAYIDEMLSQTTRSGAIEVFLKWLHERGEISNLTDRQKESYPKFRERMGIS